MRDLFRRKVAEHPELAVRASEALLKHVEECEQRNLPALAYGSEMLRILWETCRKTSPGPGLSLAEGAVQLASIAQARGQDPAPSLALAREILATCPPLDSTAKALRLRAALVSSERDDETGFGPKLDTLAVEQLASGLDLDSATAFALALHRCRRHNAPEAWADLERQIQEGSASRDAFMTAIALPFLAPAWLQLMEHKASQGQPILASLAEFRRSLHRLLEARKDLANAPVHGFLAQAALLAAAEVDHPRGILEGGLEEAKRALAQSPWSPSAIETIHWARCPGPPRLLGLQGRLYLALARTEEGPRRALFTRKALESFHEALRRAPNLEGTLDPFVTQARNLLLARCLLPSRPLPAPPSAPDARP